MNREELDFELHRLDCGHKWCGRYGYVFHPEKTGGLNIQDGRLHVWGCRVHISTEIAEAFEILRGLPDGAGHKGICAAFRQKAGLPEYPDCLHRNGRRAGLKAMSESCP